MEEVTKYRATGRRKEAVATVWLTAGEGSILVNKQPLDAYFLRETDRIIVKQPLVAANCINKYNITANIKGGGYSGQAGALRLAVARALSLVSADTRKILRKNRFLTRDPRMKERKKYGQKGARKRFQWTKR
ncbi:MAG: 30S ribosomal protein S9 [Candidatus Omnitrophota bacterium]|jgi:small subunit ribosomal protein S9